MKPADVESALVAYLPPLVGVPVSTRVPHKRPARFVRVKRIGGVRQNLVQERALVMVECWGSSDGDAGDLAGETWGAFDVAQGEFLAPGVWLSSAALSSPISNSDPDTGHDRYQFTANMVVNLSGP